MPAMSSRLPRLVVIGKVLELSFAAVPLVSAWQLAKKAGLR
jgi:hypothetical protein